MNRRTLLYALVIAVLLSMPTMVADAANTVSSNSTSNSTSYTTSAVWGELHNITLVTSAGNTTLTASWDAAVNWSQSKIYGRFLRDGVSLGTFNLTNSMYSQAGSYTATIAETAGTHYYGWEVYSTAGRKGTIHSRNFTVSFITPGEYVGLDTVNASAQIAGVTQVTGLRGEQDTQNTTMANKTEFQGMHDAANASIHAINETKVNKTGESPTFVTVNANVSGDNVTVKKVNNVLNADEYTTAQDAVDALTSTTITLIELPCGTYDSIAIDTHNAIIRGQGDCTVINGANPISFTPNTTRRYRPIIERLKINISTAGGIGIDFTNVSNGKISDVTIVGSEGNNIGVLTSGIAYYNNYYNLRISGVDTAYYFNSSITGNDPNENNIYSGSILNTVTGININYGNHINLYSPDIEGCTGDAIRTNDSSISIFSPRIESCAVAINVTSNARKTSVYNPHYSGNTMNMLDSAPDTNYIQGTYAGQASMQVSDSGAFVHTLVNLTRNSPAGTNPLINISDTYTASGTPPIIEMHKERNAGSFLIFYQGTSYNFGVLANGSMYSAGTIMPTSVNSSYYNTSDGRELQNGGCDASYCIRYNLTDGATIEAVNGTDGKVEYSGAFFRTVVNNAYILGGEGTVVHVRCGSYTQTGTINVTSKDGIFEGSGSCTIINVNDGVIPLNVSNVSGVKIRNFNMSISNRDGIVFRNVSDSEISGLNITGSFTPTGSRYAIRLYDSLRNNIYNNHVSGTGWDGGIRTENTLGGVENQSNRITDNTFYDLGGAHASYASGIGVELEAGSTMRNVNNVVSGNICRNITGHCLRAIATWHSSFTNNVGDVIGKSFVWVDGDSVGEEDDLSRFNTFVGNSANEVSEEVFDIIGEDNVFEGNVVSNSSSYAFSFATVSKNNTVRGGSAYNTTGTNDLGTDNTLKDVFGLPGNNHGNKADCTTITVKGVGDKCFNTTRVLDMNWNGTYWVLYNETRP